MSWEEIQHLAPTRNRALLGSLIGRRVVRLRHFVDEPIDELLRTIPYAHRGTTKQQVFAMAGGLVVVTLDDDREIKICSDEALVSVTIESDAFDASEWADVADATDPSVAHATFQQAVGATIVGLYVVRLELEETDTRAPSKFHGFNPKILDRPREVALSFVLENVGDLVFSDLLIDAPNNFAITIGNTQAGSMTVTPASLQFAIQLGSATRKAIGKTIQARSWR